MIARVSGSILQSIRHETTRGEVERRFGNPIEETTRENATLTAFQVSRSNSTSVTLFSSLSTQLSFLVSKRVAFRPGEKSQYGLKVANELCRLSRPVKRPINWVPTIVCVENSETRSKGPSKIADSPRTFHFSNTSKPRKHRTTQFPFSRRKNQ